MIKPYQVKSECIVTSRTINRIDTAKFDHSFTE